MVKWLEESEDKGLDFEVWGVTKEVYTMTDLKKFVGNGGTLVEKKGKGKKQGKEKVKEMEKDSGKEKGKGKEKLPDSSQNLGNKGKKKATNK